MTQYCLKSPVYTGIKFSSFAYWRIKDLPLLSLVETCFFSPLTTDLPPVTIFWRILHTVLGSNSLAQRTNQLTLLTSCSFCVCYKPGQQTKSPDLSRDYGFTDPKLHSLLTLQLHLEMERLWRGVTSMWGENTARFPSPDSSNPRHIYNGMDGRWVEGKRNKMGPCSVHLHHGPTRPLCSSLWHWDVYQSQSTPS